MTFPLIRTRSTSSGTATFSIACINPNRAATSFCSSPTTPASAPATPRIRRRTACPARAGLRSRTNASPSPCRATTFPRQPLSHRQRRLAPTGSVLVLGPQSRRRQRVVGQVLPGQRFHPDEPQRRVDGSDHHSHVPGESADAAQQRVLPFVTMFFPCSTLTSPLKIDVFVR